VHKCKTQRVSPKFARPSNKNKNNYKKVFPIEMVKDLN
jgi:hypothetical protein